MKSLISQYPNILISKKCRGMSLIEVAVGIGLVLLIGGALTSLGLMAVSTANEAKLKNVATRLAEERIEMVRGLRDSNKSTIQSGDWSFFQSAVNTSEAASAPIAVGNLIFTRRTYLSPVFFNSRVTVEVVVAYDYKGRTVVVSSTECPNLPETRPHICLTTYLTKWQ